MERVDGGATPLRHRDVILAQTKTRERVRDLAEVYTHEREVTAMLDLIPDMFPSNERPLDIGFRVLEPACGAGNFLIAVLNRKLAYVTYGERYSNIEAFETACLTALSSIYGIDIDQENINQSRHFLRADLAHHMKTQLATELVTDGFWAAAEAILATNIIRADTLKDAASIDLVEYQWRPETGYLTREWSLLDDREDPQPDLFAEVADTPRRDAVPIHYSTLAANPTPRGGA